MVASKVDPRLLAVIDAHAASRGRIQDRVFAGLAAVWGTFDGWYRPRLVEDVAAEAAATVAAGQAAQAGVTDVYMARVTTLTRERPVSPVGVSPKMRESLRSGVSGAEVQARVAAEFRWQIYRGVDPDTARETALVRARESSGQDLGLAFQRQVADFTQKRNVKRWQRVTRGEGVCGLCAAASTQMYTRGDLLPIHSRCRCSVIEVGSVLGGGKVFTDAEYEAIRGASASLSAKDLKDVRVVVDDHGELGPVLRDGRHRVSTVGKDGSVNGKGPKEPRARVLDPTNRISTMTADDVKRAERIAEKALAFARKHNLPEQVAWHEARLKALAAHTPK